MYSGNPRSRGSVSPPTREGTRKVSWLRLKWWRLYYSKKKPWTKKKQTLWCIFSQYFEAVYASLTMQCVCMYLVMMLNLLSRHCSSCVPEILAPIFWAVCWPPFPSISSQNSPLMIHLDCTQLVLCTMAGLLVFRMSAIQCFICLGAESPQGKYFCIANTQPPSHVIQCWKAADYHILWAVTAHAHKLWVPEILSHQQSS